MLIHQTQWNRLDITDLETNELLTRRESGTPKIEKKNDIDYFHSLLQIAPDGKHFLSNGWIWQPSDNIMCFETELFLEKYEISGEHIEYYRGYAWDRPCAFIGNDMFVIAADDKDPSTLAEGIEDAEAEKHSAYCQLLFYKLSEVKTHTYTYSDYEGYDTLPLAFSGKADCALFTFDEYGEIACGEIYYESETEHLLVLSEKGAFAVALDGKIIHANPEITLHAGNWAMRHDDDRAIHRSQWLLNWQYDTVRHCFYRFYRDRIEKKYITQ